MKNSASFALLALLVAGCGEDNKEKSVSEIAHDICEIEIICDPGLHSSLRECEIGVRQTLNDTALFSGACGRATHDLFGCFSTLSICDGYDDFWLERPATSYPCRTEKLTQERACVGFGSSPNYALSYCELEVACDDFYGSVGECLADVEEELEEARYVSIGCSNAYGDYVACLGQLETCVALDAFWDAEAPPYPCWQEEEWYFQQCDDF